MIPAGSVIAGVSGKILKNRRDIYDDPAEVERRHYLAMIAAEQRDAVEEGH